MIRLSNGHEFEYMIASGALAFDGKGWPWERPLTRLGLLRPELFTVVIKSLTRHPRQGNLRWWKPWECVATIPGGSVNKVGLTNKGIDWWGSEVAPTIDFHKVRMVASVYAETDDDLMYVLERFDVFPFVAVEINVSCPNTGHAREKAKSVIERIAMAKRNRATRHPLIAKLSADQPYLDIAAGLEGIVEAISLNSVSWATVFPNGPRSPLRRLEERVKGGGGGVSGEPAQHDNWRAVAEISRRTSIPVIGPSVMEYEDMERVRGYGAKAVSFGAVHLPSHPVWRHPLSLFTNPMKPTKFVERERVERAYASVEHEI